MTDVQKVADLIRQMNARQLAELRRLLGDLPGWSPGGVREPIRPLRPLDAKGVALDAPEGKSDG